MDKTNSFLGNWRIVETELWDLDDLDLVTPATLSLNPNHHGHIAFIAVEGQLDYRVVVRDGLSAIEFSFEGFDEGHEVMGRGWAVLDGEHLQGRLFFHQGDDSSFIAEREHKDRSRRALANKRLKPTAPTKRKRAAEARSLGRPGILDQHDDHEHEPRDPECRQGGQAADRVSSSRPGLATPSRFGPNRTLQGKINCK